MTSRVPPNSSLEYWTDITDINTAKERILPNCPFGPSEHLLEIVRILSLGDRVLDFGCGIGRNITTLKSFGFNVVGYDLPNMIKLCKELVNNIDLFDKWNIVKKYNYDFIFCGLVLQHIPLFALQEYLLDFQTMSKHMIVYGRVSSDHFTDKLVYDVIRESGWSLNRILQAVPCWDNKIEDHEMILWEKN